MRRQHHHVRFDRHLYHLARAGGESDITQGLEKKRVMGEHALTSLAKGLFQSFGQWVQRETQTSNFPLRVSDHQTDVVPFFRQFERGDQIDFCEDILYFHALHLHGTNVKPITKKAVLTPIENDFYALCEITSFAFCKITTSTRTFFSQCSLPPKFSTVQVFVYSGSNMSFPTAQTGHAQSSGISSNAVPGATPESGSPVAGSYTYPQTVHTYFFIVYLSFPLLSSDDGSLYSKWPVKGMYLAAGEIQKYGSLNAKVTGHDLRSQRAVLRKTGSAPAVSGFQSARRLCRLYCILY